MLHRMSKNYRGPIRRSVRLSTAAIAPDPSIFIVDNPNESNEEKAEGDLASDLYRPFAYTQDLIDTSDLPAHNTAPEHMVAPAPEHVVAPAPEHMVAPAPEHMIAPAPEELPSKKRLPDAEVAEDSPASRAQPKPVDDSSQSDAEAGASKFPTASIQGNKAPTMSEETEKGPEGVTSLRLGRMDEIADINSVDSNDSIDSVKTVTLGESPNL